MGLRLLVQRVGRSRRGDFYLDEAAWSESPVRRVLHVFACGGAATDAQIAAWLNMAPVDAIREMLTFDAVNPRLSPVEDVTANYANAPATGQ